MRSCFEGIDSKRQLVWFAQEFPAGDDTVDESFRIAHWAHFWDCLPCSYPDRTGDLRSVVTIADFYSAPYLLAAGHTNTQIARLLGLTEGTVRVHLETSTAG